MKVFLVKDGGDEDDIVIAENFRDIPHANPEQITEIGTITHLAKGVVRTLTAEYPSQTETP